MRVADVRADDAGAQAGDLRPLGEIRSPLAAQLAVGGLEEIIPSGATRRGHRLCAGRAVVALSSAWCWGKPLVGGEVVGAQVQAYIFGGDVIAQAAPRLGLVEFDEFLAEGPEVCVGVGSRCRPASFHAGRDSSRRSGLIPALIVEPGRRASGFCRDTVSWSVRKRAAWCGRSAVRRGRARRRARR